MANANQTIVNRSQLLAAATAIGAVALLAIPTPARAGPMFPLAPACAQYGFDGKFSLRQDNGFRVSFTSTGRAATGEVVATGDNGWRQLGYVTGGIKGRNVDFTTNWDRNSGTGPGHYLGVVGDDGFVRGGTTLDQSNVNVANWSSTLPLGCLDAPLPPPPPVISATIGEQVPAGPAAARLGVAVNGPTTLRAGMSGSYTVNLSNPGDVGAPVELYVSFGGQLQQTGPVNPSGGVNCDVINNAGGTSAVRCNAQQLESKATAQIVVQARGPAPGAGHLTVNINSSDPGAQFVQKSQKLNVSIS
ncbi:MULTISPECIES: hypothetical protein [unclassified Mycobacterium]|uniref:hypothetical protein n=1 Tax=unclassified Mycobacterium TaxID=2642494 RepID=UPI0029C71F11|nr:MULTISPECIES: hypothetical protein [unclassified Mycobacterium]